jgi:hypothetical protein
LEVATKSQTYLNVDILRACMIRKPTMTTADLKLERLRQNDPRMTDLDVWLNRDDAFVDSLTAALQANSTVHTASILYTRPSSMEDVNKSLLSLLETLGRIPTLRKICITGPTSSSYVFPIQALALLLLHAKRCTCFSVGRLIVSGTKTNLDQLAEAFRNHSCLEDVYLNGSILFGGALGLAHGQEHLLQAISSSKTLKSLTLNGLGYGGSTSRLSPESLFCLGQSQTVTKLWIFDFDLADDHLKCLIQGIRGNSLCQIVELRLSSCRLGATGLTALAGLLLDSWNNRTLQVLHLWIKELVVPKLKNDPTEHTHSYLALADALRRSRLRDCRLETGAQYIQQLLDSTTEHYQHPITSHHVQAAFCQAIRNNYYLETFSIPGGQDHHRMEIAFYLKLNRLGRRRLFCPDRHDTQQRGLKSHQHRSKRARSESTYNLKSEWVNVLIAARHDCSCLCYFLLMNPSLCHIPC